MAYSQEFNKKRKRCKIRDKKFMHAHSDVASSPVIKKKANYYVAILVSCYFYIYTVLHQPEYQ